jgi:membrane associated rhomboid family serine protease
MIQITYIIIAVTVLVSVIAMNNDELKGKLLFNAYAIRHRREWYRLFTHALVHGDFMHLMFNMYAFYSFGIFAESAYGYFFAERATFFYVLLYVGGIFMSSAYSYEKHKDDMYYNALGASGAVSAVVFACILISPVSKIQLIFLPGLGIPSWVFGILYLVGSWYMARKGSDNIGHDAHFFGALYGIAFTLCIKPELAKAFLAQVTGSIN